VRVSRVAVLAAWTTGRTTHHWVPYPPAPFNYRVCQSVYLLLFWFWLRFPLAVLTVSPPFFFDFGSALAKKNGEVCRHYAETSPLPSSKHHYAMLLLRLSQAYVKNFFKRIASRGSSHFSPYRCLGILVFRLHELPPGVTLPASG
jgi:hypothetical protein